MCNTCRCSTKYIDNVFTTPAKNETKSHSILLGSHLGICFDAPYHLLEDGSKFGKIPLDTFVGNVVEIDVISKSAEGITWVDEVDNSFLLYLLAPLK